MEIGSSEGFPVRSKHSLSRSGRFQRAGGERERGRARSNAREQTELGDNEYRHNEWYLARLLLYLPSNFS